MKIPQFPTTALFNAIYKFIPPSEIGDTILDIAHEIGDKIYFARVISEPYCDEGSDEAFNITTFQNRDQDQAVYLTPRGSSTFGGNLDDAVQLLKEGYKVYPMEEYEHSAISVRMATTTPIRSQKAILNGSFRNELSLHCRWDSNFAFYAQPKEWSKPTSELFEEFSNWLNGYSFSYQVLSATPGPLNDDGETTFILEKLNDCSYYYSEETAEEVALDALNSCVQQLERDTVTSDHL